MASINKAIIVGNLGKDPETRYAPSGDCICNITVATTDRWKDRASGEMKEQTEWHKVSFFGKLGEIAAAHLHKGSQVYVEGSLRTRKWVDKEGVDRYTTEIRADVMQMLGGKGESSERHTGQPQRQQAPARAPAQQPTTGSGFEDFESDIPF